MGNSVWCKGYLRPDGIVKAEDERYYRFDGKELECSRHLIRKIRMVPEKVANLFLDYDLTYAMISAKSGWGVMELREFFDRVQEYRDELSKEELRKKHRAEISRRYYANNREKRNAYQREYFRKNRERLLAERHERYIENREEGLKYSEEYREEHRKKITEYNREYYKKHREKQLESKRRYYEKNREKICAYQRAYHAKNLDKANEYQREYARKRREQRKLLNNP